MDKDPHIIVVGAGIIGSSIARHLARRGVGKVTVLEAEDAPGRAASHLSFAWINGRNKDPRSYHELNRRSLDLWDRYAADLGCSQALRWGGEMQWACSEGGARQLRERVEQLQSWDYPIRQLSAAEVRAMEPGVEFGELAAASFTPIDGHVDTAMIIAAALEQVCASRGTVRTGARVVGIQSGEGRQAVILDEGERLPCDVVVLAGGAEVSELAGMVDARVPMANTFGATVVTEPVPALFEQVSVVHSPRDGSPPMVNVRQLVDGRVMVHGGNHDHSLGRTQEEVAEVMASAARFFPALEGAQVTEVRRGLRPMPADGHPAVGFAPGPGKVYVAVMHSGVTLAPLVGEMSAREIVDGACESALEPFRPDRFT